MIPTRRLPRAARLADGKVFARLLRGRRRIVDCLELAIDRTDAPFARLGVVVGRKQLPLAVDRNTVKRIVREAFRLQRSSLPPRELVIRLRTPLKNEDRALWRPRVAAAAAKLMLEAAK